MTFDRFSIEFAMRKSLLFMFILLIACAHKAPPISKDRLNPRLTKITALNTRQLLLTFSEEIDTLALYPDSFNITCNIDTLSVTLLYPSLSASEIAIATSPMSNALYEISGTVFDKAENRGHFISSFQGTTAPDTVSPWVTNYAEGRNTKEFFLNFSEAMDTATLSFSVVPKKNLVPTWINFRYVRFLPEPESESLGHDTTYYLYLRTARDISGNDGQSVITAITPDSIYRPLRMKGKVTLNGNPVTHALAILKREIPIAIAMVKNGEFTFDVRDSLPFDLLVATGEYSGQAQVVVGADNIVTLQQGKVDIDAIID